MPLSQSLWLGTSNVFHDPDGWELTSDRFRWYAGGLLRHVAAVTAVVAPTPDAYPIRAGAEESTLAPYLSGAGIDAVCRVPARMVGASTRRLPRPTDRRLDHRTARASRSGVAAARRLALARSHASDPHGHALG